MKSKSENIVALGMRLVPYANRNRNISNLNKTNSNYIKMNHNETNTVTNKNQVR